MPVSGAPIVYTLCAEEVACSMHLDPKRNEEKHKLPCRCRCRSHTAYTYIFPERVARGSNENDIIIEHVLGPVDFVAEQEYKDV